MGLHGLTLENSRGQFAARRKVNFNFTDEEMETFETFGYQYLTLHWNRLSGTMPPELYVGLSSELAVLNLERNGGIGGTISTWIGTMSNLTTILLSKNSISGTLPTEILARLSKLTTLLVGINKLTGPIPEFPTKITSLDLQNNVSGCILCAL